MTATAPAAMPPSPPKAIWPSIVRPLPPPGAAAEGASSGASCSEGIAMVPPMRPEPDMGERLGCGARGYPP
ncbi:MAG: hypothetical protein QM820_05395 [Minicystis sp.]